MANRRMFALSVVSTDDFLDLPIEAQALYLQLGVRADDDGFVASPRSITRSCGVGTEYLALLCRQGYLLTFESGVCAIVHWRVSNYIQSDRYHPTLYLQEKQQLYLDGVGRYTLTETDTPLVSIPDTEVRSGKDRSSEDRSGEAISAEAAQQPEESRGEAVCCDSALEQAIDSFLEMRREMGQPVTKKGLPLLRQKLSELSDDEAEQTAIVNQSVLHGWKGLFPLDAPPGGKRPFHPPAVESDDSWMREYMTDMTSPVP